MLATGALAGLSLTSVRGTPHDPTLSPNLLLCHSGIPAPSPERCEMVTSSPAQLSPRDVASRGHLSPGVTLQPEFLALLGLAPGHGQACDPRWAMGHQQAQLQKRLESTCPSGCPGPAVEGSGRLFEGGGMPPTPASQRRARRGGEAPAGCPIPPSCHPSERQERVHLLSCPTACPWG